MKPRIHLVLEYADGRSWNIEIDGERITTDMVAVAEDLLETLSTGDRPPIKGLYDLCAQAFNVSRDDAKKRILAASYGMSKAKIEGSSSRGQALATLAAARRERKAAHDEVISWMDAEGFRRGTSPRNEEAPGWDRFVRAEYVCGYATRNFEAWLDGQEIDA